MSDSATTRERQISRAPVKPKTPAPPSAKKKPFNVVWTLMALPATAFIVALIFWPFLQSVTMSFQEVRLGRPSVWVGVENYVRLFADPQAHNGFWVTAVFALGATALELVLAWSFALLLFNSFKRMNTVFRVLFAIPMMLSPVVVGVVFRIMFNPQYGWIPALSGVPGLDVLADPGTALVTMIVVDAWQWTPFLFLIIAAGLASVPEEMLEAARLDGAGPVRIFSNILWPMVLPVTIVGVLFRFLDALKTFDLPYNLTSGGPGNATQTIAIYLYRQAFTRYDQGYASAISLVTTIALALVAVLLLWFMRRAERNVA